MLHLFTPCQVLHGDKRLRGSSITCGKCARVEQIHHNTFKTGGKDDDDLVGRRIAKKFEELGWKVGKSPGLHRCPICIKEGRAARMRYLHATKGARTMAAEVVDLKVEPKPAPHAEPPRQMERSDRRLIFAKLEEAYDDEQTGYNSGWTDERVAQDLGIPVAWVRLVRDENFGPLGSNPEINKLLEEAQRWRGELVAILERSTVLLAETKKLTDRGDIIERRLAEIAKTVGRG